MSERNPEDEPHPEGGTVETGGQVMTQAQYDAARFPLIDERDRLRAVVDALNEEHAALWRVVNALRLHEQTVAANQDGAEQAIADHWQAVGQALDALDGSGDMGGGSPVDTDRQRIWSAINAWEERGYALNADGEVVATDITHKPLAPFFNELRAIVFDEGGADD